MLQNFDEALEAFQKVLTFEPTNKAAQNQLIVTRNKIKTLREAEKKRYRNMFDKLAAESKDEEPPTEEPKLVVEYELEILLHG